MQLITDKNGKVEVNIEKRKLIGLAGVWMV